MRFLLTDALKRHAEEKLGVKAGADERTYRLAIGLTLSKGGQADLRALLKAAIPPTPTPAPTPAPAPVPAPAPAPALAPVPAFSEDDFDKAVEASTQKALERLGVGVRNDGTALTPEVVFSQAETARVRVKGAAEGYSSTTKAAHYPDRSGVKGDGSPHLLAGRRAVYGTRPLDLPSDLDKAVSGAYFKWCIRQTSETNLIPRWARFTDHDRDLVHHALQKMPWTGLIGGGDGDAGAVRVNHRKLNDFEVKALLDDSVSGGIEITPVVFDDAIITTPILYGELFPYVKVVNIARGRRVKGGAIANPTFTSGIAEGTAITPFSTSGFVSAFDTTIFPAVGAMELGQDFEEDSPVDLGALIIERYGLKALEWLDRVIAVGDGVTEPNGFMNTTGANTVNSDAGAGGPLTVSDFEGLMFGMTKQFRNEPGAMPVYVSNDTMYRRARGIPVGPADERRVFGMTHGDYQIMERPYKVQNSIANGKIAYVNLQRYRMYRRLGLNVRVETAGRTLALSNTRLIVVRMRWGGQQEIGGSVSLMTDAWSA